MCGDTGSGLHLLKFPKGAELLPRPSPFVNPSAARKSQDNASVNTRHGTRMICKKKNAFIFTYLSLKNNIRHLRLIFGAKAKLFLIIYIFL